MLSLKKIGLVIIAFLSSALAIVIALLTGKNKELKLQKEKIAGLEKNVKKQNEIITESASIRKETNTKIENIENGNSTTDFNACIDELSKLSKK